MDYYSLFWDPRATFMVAEPQGALTYRSSTLTSLTILTRLIDYYSPFWGPMRFLGFRTPTFDYVQVINTRSLADSGPFRGLLITILGSRSDFNGY